MNTNFGNNNFLFTNGIMNDGQPLGANNAIAINKTIRLSILELIEQREWTTLEYTMKKLGLSSLSSLNNDHFDILIYALERWGRKNIVREEKEQEKDYFQERINYILNHSSYKTLNYAFYDYQEKGSNESSSPYHREMVDTDSFIGDHDNVEQNTNNISGNESDPHSSNNNNEIFSNDNTSHIISPISSVQTQTPFSNSLHHFEMTSEINHTTTTTTTTTVTITNNNNSSSSGNMNNTSVNRNDGINTRNHHIIRDSSSIYYGLFKVPLFTCILMENYSMADFLLNYGKETFKQKRKRTDDYINRNYKYIHHHHHYDYSINRNENDHFNERQQRQQDALWIKPTKAETEAAHIDYCIPDFYVMYPQFKKEYDFGDVIHYLKRLGRLTPRRLQYILSRGFPLAMVNTFILHDLVLYCIEEDQEDSYATAATINNYSNNNNTNNSINNNYSSSSTNINNNYSSSSTNINNNYSSSSTNINNNYSSSSTNINNNYSSSSTNINNNYSSSSTNINNNYSSSSSTNMNNNNNSNNNSNDHHSSYDFHDNSHSRVNTDSTTSPAVNIFHSIGRSTLHPILNPIKTSREYRGYRQDRLCLLKVLFRHIIFDTDFILTCLQYYKHGRRNDPEYNNNNNNSNNDNNNNVNSVNDDNNNDNYYNGNKERGGGERDHRCCCYNAGLSLSTEELENLIRREKRKIKVKESMYEQLHRHGGQHQELVKLLLQYDGSEREQLFQRKRKYLI